MSNSQLEALLWEHNPVFSAPGKKICSELAQKYPATLFMPNEQLVSSGDSGEHLYVVLSGTVRIYHRSEDGRELVVKLLRAPNSYGDIAVLHDLPFLENLAAVDESLVAKIPVPEYVAFLKQHKNAAFENLKHMGAAFCVAARNEQQVFAPIKQRIANLLLSYADFYGVHQDEGAARDVMVTHPLSQNDVAQSLAVVRRSVAQILGEWQKSGIITKQDGFFVLNRVDWLEELAAPIRGSLCYYIGMPLTKLTQRPAATEAMVEIVKGRDAMVGLRYAVGEQLLIGRHPPCGLLLPDDMVSPQHCRVFRSATGSRYWVQDLESLNGTLVSGKCLQRAVLKDDTELQIGSTRLRFYFSSSEPGS